MVGFVMQQLAGDSLSAFGLPIAVVKLIEEDIREFLWGWFRRFAKFSPLGMGICMYTNN